MVHKHEEETFKVDNIIYKTYSPFDVTQRS